MCGIAGWVSYEHDLTHEEDVVDAMTATMSRRGPDDSGTWVRRHVALGHRRLAVIDPPGGAQPMTVTAAAGTAVIVYSGEVYNYLELRADLVARGHVFRTDSDTEVVAHAYLEWGERVADHLNGMFAFGVWHERHQELTLVRDRMGVKPLYYRLTPDGVLFGSEPKAILANPLAPAIVDLDGLPELFPETRAPGGSPWKDIVEVEPGSVLTVTRSGLRRRTYWTLPTRAHGDDTGTTVQTVRDLLADIVRRQLVSDVPLCLLLSGGLDSSSITALAAEQQDEDGRLRTFSVDFVDRASVFRPSALHPSLDTPYATEVADHVESTHTNVTLQLDDLTDPALRRAVIVARDMPGQGQGDASLHQLFAAVRGDSAVALSGESADEVFGGYRWFHDADARQSPTFPWLTWHADMHASDGPFVSMLRPERAAQLDIAARTADQYARARRAVEHLDHASPIERRMREISYLALTHFVRTWLDRKDRMSMAVGLEVRVPFCDHRLVEYVYNAPWAMKTFDGREKSLLRQAVKELLPQSVVQRQKSGYPAMVDPRYGAALQIQAREVLAEPQHPVFSLVSRPWLERAVALDPEQVIRSELAGISLALDLYHWLDIYRPTLILN